jgi:hypothetical protein
VFVVFLHGVIKFAFMRDDQVHGQLNISVRAQPAFRNQSVI